MEDTVVTVQAHKASAFALPPNVEMAYRIEIVLSPSKGFF
jgi:hypothetical protein